MHSALFLAKLLAFFGFHVFCKILNLYVGVQDFGSQFLNRVSFMQKLKKNIRIYKIIPFFHKLIGCGSTTIMYGLFIAQERVLLTSKPQATTVKTYGWNWKQKCKLSCVLQF